MRVYFYIAIDEGSPGVHKIGISNNPERRLREIKKESRRSLTIIYTRYFGNRWRAFAAELLLKRALENRRCKKMHGIARTEWFRVSKDEIIQTLTDVIPAARRRKYDTSKPWRLGWGEFCRSADIYGPAP